MCSPVTLSGQLNNLLLPVPRPRQRKYSILYLNSMELPSQTIVRTQESHSYLRFSIIFQECHYHHLNPTFSDTSKIGFYMYYY